MWQKCFSVKLCDPYWNLISKFSAKFLKFYSQDSFPPVIFICSVQNTKCERNSSEGMLILTTIISFPVSFINGEIMIKQVLFMLYYFLLHFNVVFWTENISRYKTVHCQAIFQQRYITQPRIEYHVYVVQNFRIRSTHCCLPFQPQKPGQFQTAFVLSYITFKSGYSLQKMK